MNDSNWTVSASDRYLGAWGEINSRLALRQTVRLSYVSISWVMLGIVASVVLTDSFTHNNFGFLQQATIGLLLTFIPIMSLAFSLWSYYDDFLLGLLSCLCRTLESGYEPTAGIIPPGWHTPSQNWLSEARTVRKYFDWAFHGITYLTSIITAIITMISVKNTLLLVGFLLAQVVFCILTTVVNNVSSKKRKDLRNDFSYDWVLGEYKRNQDLKRSKP